MQIISKIKVTWISISFCTIGNFQNRFGLGKCQEKMPIWSAVSNNIFYVIWWSKFISVMQAYCKIWFPNVIKVQNQLWSSYELCFAHKTIRTEKNVFFNLSTQIIGHLMFLLILSSQTHKNQFLCVSTINLHWFQILNSKLCYLQTDTASILRCFFFSFNFIYHRNLMIRI